MKFTHAKKACQSLGVALTLLLAGPVLSVAQDTPKFPEYATVVKDAKVYEGLFKLHQKDEKLFAEIRPDQFDRPFLAPISIARGLGVGGHTLNFEEQWVVTFKRVGDKVQLIRRNVRFQAKADTPAHKAVETTYTDSVLMALPIRTLNPARQSVVIDFSDIFLSDFGDLGMGNIDRNRTHWHKIKTFPKNIELQVSATFAGGRGSREVGGGGDSVIDPRGTTVIVHYGLVELPDGGFQPRLADDRVGHFLSVVKDFSDDNRDTAFRRYVTRWRLERSDGSAWKEGGKLVPPKKKIIFWIEKSVPNEYRAAVREGILEWNKAFEKIGFRDAIEVRQQENEDFDPEDVTYNTFRWITSDAGYAMGPSRANPLTGEIIDADIVFDASMVRFAKIQGIFFQNAQGRWVEPDSPIELSRRGWGITQHSPRGNDLPSNPNPNQFRGWNDREDEQRRNQSQAIRQGFCQCCSHKANQLGLAMLALQAEHGLKLGDKIPEELIQQAVKETTMHEVGHTLGLRHNFKASSWLANDQLHDTNVTRKQGLVASVMDYNPVNLAPKGGKQGDFFTSTIGPYDYWAIEYAYTPIGGGTDAELEPLKKIASKCAQSGFDYGTDEDLFTTSDPHINQWDLGSDVMKFAQDRILLSEELFKGLADRVVEEGEGYQRARMAFSTLLQQYGDASFLVSQYVGGEFAHRDHRGDPKARDPFIPVKATKQRAALKFLSEHTLSDQHFQFSPELLRKLAADRWLHWGNERIMYNGTDFPLYERILGVQRVVLRNLLDSGTMRRIQTLTLKAEKDDNPLTIAEVFRALTDATFIDLPLGDKAPTVKSSTIRRNLQREYLHNLQQIVLRGANHPQDAKSLARFHLKELNKRIEAALRDPKLDDTAKAHLDECKEQIERVLKASIQTQEP